MEYLLKTGHLSDCSFVVYDNDGKKVILKCHKFILMRWVKYILYFFTIFKYPLVFLLFLSACLRATSKRQRYPIILS